MAETMTRTERGHQFTYEVLDRLADGKPIPDGMTRQHSAECRHKKCRKR